MVQLREDLHLGPLPGDGGGVPNTAVEDLDRDGPAEQLVGTAVDLGGGAATEQLLQPVSVVQHDPGNHAGCRVLRDVRLGRIQPAAGRRFGIRCGISLVTIGSVERKSGGFAWFVVGSHIGQRSGFARIGRVK